MASMTRADVAAVFSEQKATDILQPATAPSVVLNAFPTQPVAKSVFRVPLLDTLPTAHFVAEGTDRLADQPTATTLAAEGSEASRKKTTSMSWTSKAMYVEEIAAIVKVHNNVVNDADIDLEAVIRQRIPEAFAQVLDDAVLFGTNAPATWADAGLVPKAIAAGNVTTRGTDLVEDINQTFADVEDDGFDVNIAFADRRLRSQFRGLRDKNGNTMYLDSIRGGEGNPTIFGQDLLYPPAQRWNGAAASMLVGDRTAAVVGIREDIRVDFLDQATIDGVNLAEQDMVAWRFYFRVAFGTFYSPIHRPDNAYPFAVLAPAAAGA